MSREEWHGSCRKLARGPRTLGKTANRAVVAADYSVFIPVCLPWGIIPSVSEAPKTKGAETVPRHSLAVREAMLVICRARGWQKDNKLAWPGANMSGFGGLSRLLYGVAEQLAEGRTKKPRFFSQGFDSRAYALGHISELCLLYTSPSPRDLSTSRMPSSA